MEWIEIVKDLNAGTIGGVAGIIAGHPLDTIKVRLQTQATRLPIMSGITTTMKQISKSEGFTGFYKGMLSPIISNAPINAVVFAAYGQVSRLLLNHSQSDELTPVEHLFAGSIAGFLQTVFAAPSELVKITLQVDQKAKKNNSIETGLRIYRKYGITRGLYHGWGITALRDVPAFGIYFCTYDITKQQLTQGLAENETNFNLMMAGGIAGSLSWLILQPVDVLKSMVQSIPPDQRQPALEIAQRCYKQEGIAFFTKGIGATLLRAFPVSAVTFLVYEKTMAYFSKYF